MLEKGIYFVTGIDTDAGKSYATAILAKKNIESGKSVITQKFIQTGCSDTISEDVLTHRRIMGLPLQDVDIQGSTSPQIFKFPASPHLAARLENREIDLNKIKEWTKILAQKYDIVLIEGAGGLLVPITENYLTADYITDNKLNVIIVTSPRLGSINHTLLTMEVCKARNIAISALVYNHFPPDANKIIADDTLCFLKKRYPDIPIYETEFIK